MILGAARWLWPAMLGLLFCGCSKSSKPPEVQTLPVTGTITLDGKPLAGAAVIFMTLTTPASFVGTTKEDGSYQLVRMAQGKSICKGPCKVIVSRMLKPDGSPVPAGEPPATSGATESIPKRYSSAEATELKCDVPEGGGKFDFDLKSK